MDSAPITSEHQQQRPWRPDDGEAEGFAINAIKTPLALGASAAPKPSPRSRERVFARLSLAGSRYSSACHQIKGPPAKHRKQMLYLWQWASESVGEREAENGEQGQRGHGHVTADPQSDTHGGARAIKRR